MLSLAINNSSEFGINFNGIMLFLSGFVTILPLLTFNASTKYLKLSTIGFLQYISPTLSMIIAVFIYNETLDFYKIISFALIWISLAIATISNLRRKNGTK